MQIKKKIKEIDIKPIKNKKCTSIDPQELCQKMYLKLKEIDQIKDVNEVYIENQPTFINPTMKAISSMLFSYFVYFFETNNLTNRIIKFVSPSIKIDIDKTLIEFINKKIIEHNKIKSEKCKCRKCSLNKEMIENQKKFNDSYPKFKFGYDSIKELGVIYTEKILIDNKIENNFNLIDAEKKKDDLCDAFLHGYKRIVTKK